MRAISDNFIFKHIFNICVMFQSMLQWADDRFPIFKQAFDWWFLMCKYLAGPLSPGSLQPPQDRRGDLWCVQSEFVNRMWMVYMVCLRLLVALVQRRSRIRMMMAACLNWRISTFSERSYIVLRCGSQTNLGFMLLYWSRRCDMACPQPTDVQTRLG